ncbi:MAG: flavin reductase [Acholeplasmatales bacterium]|nr:flavin reductase [Acholeplasmatales bacterium]
MLKKDINSYNGFFNEINNNWAILTCGDKFIGSNSMTVSWGGIGYLWDKPVCFVFVRESRHTKKFIDKSDSVTLSFLSDKYKKALAVFGSKSGKDVDKFKETGLHKTFDLDYNGYYVCESDYVLKCKKLFSLDITKDKLPDYIKDDFYKNEDYHTLYVCEIKQYLVNEE